MIEYELNTDQISAMLARLTRALTDMSPVWQDIGELMVESTKANFTAGTAPDGTPWAPKSPATIAAYEKRGDKVDFRPLYGPSGALSSTIFAQADARSVEWGSAMIYAGVQQFGAAAGAFGNMANGSPIPWGAIPARPFIGLSDQDNANIATTIEEYLQTAAGVRD